VHHVSAEVAGLAAGSLALHEGGPGAQIDLSVTPITLEGATGVVWPVRWTSPSGVRPKRECGNSTPNCFTPRGCDCSGEFVAEWLTT